MPAGRSPVRLETRRPKGFRTPLPGWWAVWCPPAATPAPETTRAREADRRRAAARTLEGRRAVAESSSAGEQIRPREINWGVRDLLSAFTERLYRLGRHGWGTTLSRKEVSRCL